jgi:hypothetical protein
VAQARLVRLNLPHWACQVAHDRNVHETYDVHDGMKEGD